MDSGQDPDGRIAYLKTICSGKKIAFISAYVPNMHNPKFFDSLRIILANLTLFQLVIGTDMNSILDRALDKSGMTNVNLQLSSSLHQLINDFGLIDVWRAHNPNVREYTVLSFQPDMGPIRELILFYFHQPYVLLSRNLKSGT